MGINREVNSSVDLGGSKLNNPNRSVCLPRLVVRQAEYRSLCGPGRRAREVVSPEEKVRALPATNHWGAEKGTARGGEAPKDRL